MADKEFIIGLLEHVRRRVRSERRFKTITAGLAIALIFPVVFKIIDLLWPFRGLTVAIVLGVWGLAAAVVLGWKTRSHETMADAAVSLDRRAGMQDQVKSAYWFIRHPSPSEWI